jgi:endonuclease YncB( thermonuclease family)
MVRTVLQVHKDEVQARPKPSTTPHVIRGDKVTIATENLFMRGQPNQKPRYRQLGPFTIEEQIGKYSS